MSISKARTQLSLVITWALAWAVSIQTPARAHDVTVTLDGAGPITKTLLPVLGDLNFSDTGVFMIYPSPTPGPGLPGWDCTAIYGLPEDNTPDIPEDVLPHLKQQVPDIKSGDGPPKSEAVVVGWDCIPTFTEPIVWNPRFYCRDWTAIHEVNGHIPVDDGTFELTFEDDGRVHADFDLDHADITLTLILAGNRVPNLGCNILHPFDETIVYAVDVHVGGLHGSVDVTLASAAPDALGGTNSTVYVQSIDANTFKLEIDRDSVTIDTVTNNKVDELLLAGLATLGPLPGVPLIFGAASLAWINDNEVADVVLGVATSLYGFGSGDCDNTEDCLVDVVQGLLQQRIDLDMNFGLFTVHNGINTGSLVDSEEVIADVIERINEGIALPLAWTTNVASSGIGLNVSAALSSLETSAARNSLTTTWAVSVTNTAVSSCSTGLTGYVAPPAGTPGSVRGDVDITVPFSLIGDAAQSVLRQVNFCTNVNAGPFTGLVTPNGPLRVARGGTGRIDLTVPARMNATGTNSTGILNFNVLLQTAPGVNSRGDIQLNLTTLYITNVTGVINTVVPPGIPSTYTFGAGGAFVTTPAGTFPAPTLTPTIEAAVNGMIAPFFPIPLVQRSTIYIAPHVYLQADGLVVNSGSFTLGIDIKDGSGPVDIAVSRIEGAGPYTESSTIFGRIRTVPLWAIIKNRETWDVSPPVDVTVAVGMSEALYWIPPLQPGEEYAIPFTVYVAVDSAGSVTLGPTITVTADILGMNPVAAFAGQSTINDPDRSNNVFNLKMDNAWFRPDYKVEIASIAARLAMLKHGQIITNYSVESADFTVTVRVRNVGGESAAPNLLRSLDMLVHDEVYGSRFVGGLDVGQEVEVVFDFHVPDGPSAMDCTYRFKADLAGSDAKAGNDWDYSTLEVESSGCVGGGPTDADLEALDQTIDDVLESKFEGLNQVTWGTDNRGYENSGLGSVGSNAPILDELDPLPGH